MCHGGVCHCVMVRLLKAECVTVECVMVGQLKAPCVHHGVFLVVFVCCLFILHCSYCHLASFVICSSLHCSYCHPALLSAEHGIVLTVILLHV